MASLVLFGPCPTRQHERASRCETAQTLTTSLAMPYISTRGKTAPMGFGEAVMTGLARDGGPLLPAQIPQCRTGFRSGGNSRIGISPSRSCVFTPTCRKPI